MSDYETVGRAGSVPVGAIAAFDVRGSRIAVANVEGTLYAFDDACTHAACPLSSGLLIGKILRCRCHSSEFDVTSGKVLAEPAEEPLILRGVRETESELQIEAG